MHRGLLVLLVGGLLTGCEPPPVPASEDTDTLDDPDPPLGCLEISPVESVVADVNLTVPPQVAPSARITLSNPCTAPVEVASFRQEARAGQASAFRLPDEPPWTLGPGEQYEVEVLFDPPTVETHTVDFFVASTADRADAGFTVSGRGTGPKLQVSPGAHDFGSPYPGCDQEQQFELENTGTHPLTVTGVELVDGDAFFALDLDPFANPELPWSLPAGGARTFYARFLPVDIDVHQARLLVTSDDPVSPRQTVDLIGTATRYRRNTDSLVVPSAVSDVLVVLERTETARDYNIVAANAVDALVEEARAAGVDLQLAVAVAEDGCILGPDPYIDTTFTATRSRVSALRMADLDFERADPPSSPVTAREVGLAALTPPATASGGCNDRLLRQFGNLDVVFVTPQGDPSPTSWSAYLNPFQALRVDPDEVRIHVIGGSSSGDVCAGTDLAPGYREAAIASGGLAEDICTVDWRATFARIGEAAARPRVASLTLSEPAVPGTVGVVVDGTERVDGWTLVPSFDTVLLDPAPPAGTPVEITYDVWHECGG